MHPNQAFRKATTCENAEFARSRGFGILAVTAGGAPMLSHIPFLLSEDNKTAEFHLVRSNPIARALNSPLQARLAVSGPDGYVSPDWYGLDDQVPTWNYVAVHLTGEIERRPQEELLDLLDRQSAMFEDQLYPKPPWKTDKVAPDALEKLMRMIVPCRMRVDAIDGTWKLNQNKPAEAREGAADNMKAYGIGADTALLSALMRGVVE
ncbi:MAG: FMN-binding negative transcriptional regulator [Paracoccaceae bacterium]